MHKPAQVELQLDRPQLPYSETLGPIIAGGSPAHYRRRQPNPTRKGTYSHKTLRCKYTTTSSRERDELGQEPCLRSQFAWTEFAQCLCNLCTILRLLKQSFYMSRVRRKEGPKTYSRIPRKSYLNYEILKPRQIGGVEKLSTDCRHLMNLHSLLDFLNKLESFNTWSWNVVSWSI